MLASHLFAVYSKGRTFCRDWENDFDGSMILLNLGINWQLVHNTSLFSLYMSPESFHRCGLRLHVWQANNSSVSIRLLRDRFRGVRFNSRPVIVSSLLLAVLPCYPSRIEEVKLIYVA